MTKPTHNPKGRPVTTPETGKPVEELVEEKPTPPEFICGGCQSSMPQRYPCCPFCGVKLEWG